MFPKITLTLSGQDIGRRADYCINNMLSLFFTSLHLSIENPGSRLETELVSRHKISLRTPVAVFL